MPQALPRLPMTESGPPREQRSSAWLRTAQSKSDSLLPIGSTRPQFILKTATWDDSSFLRWTRALAGNRK